MKKIAKTYSIEEVKEKMENYLDASQERLRSRLRQAWKKQTTKIMMLKAVRQDLYVQFR
ncbi:MAG: hypothetical protein AAB410_05415 [Patescibacteria group bacterium]